MLIILVYCCFLAFLAVFGFAPSCFSAPAPANRHLQSRVLLQCAVPRLAGEHKHAPWPALGSRMMRSMHPQSGRVARSRPPAEYGPFGPVVQSASVPRHKCTYLARSQGCLLCFDTRPAAVKKAEADQQDGQAINRPEHDSLLLRPAPLPRSHVAMQRKGVCCGTGGLPWMLAVDVQRPRKHCCSRTHSEPPSEPVRGGFSQGALQRCSPTDLELGAWPTGAARPTGMCLWAS